MKKIICCIVLLLLVGCAAQPTKPTQPINPVTTSSPTIVSAVELKNSDNLVIFPADSSKKPISVKVSYLFNEADVHCMATALYFEARGEGDKGMIAVGYTILNRVADDRFPSNVCDVVHQGIKRHGKMVRNKCQFNFYCDGKSDKPSNKKLFNHIVILSRKLLRGQLKNPVGVSIYYHETQYNPRWARVFKFEKRIGHHLFYSDEELTSS